MLKKRIIPIQLLMNGRLVKTQQFGATRDVGNPVTSSKVYSSQSADELVFLNISRDDRSIHSLTQVIDQVSEVCFMPLAFGGGVRSLADADLLIMNGADKVVLNSIAYTQPDVISRIADKFGSQAVIVSIDAKRTAPGSEPELFSDCGRKAEAVSLNEHLETCIRAGAGEILIQSIDRDGMMNGYDIELIRQVSERSSIPVIGCGGAGHYEHMKDAFLQTQAGALACGSLFNFGDNNPIRAKAFLSNYQIPFKKV